MVTIASRTEAPAIEQATGRALIVPPSPSLPQVRPGAFERPRRRHVGLAVALLLALLAVIGWLTWRSQPMTVAAAHPRIGPAVALVYASGYVEPQHPVAVAARVTAPVMKVLVEEGDRVRRGQPLVLLEDEQQQGILAQAEAQRRQAVLDEGRKLTLFAQGWVTRAERDQAVAAAAAARAVERSARGQLDQYVIRSRVDGVVLKRDVEPGDLASPASSLFTLGDPRRVRITTTIDERDIPLIRPGQEALMKNDAWPGRVLRGHVSEVTPSGDPTQRAFRARLRLDEAAAPPLGMTLEVNIVTRRNDHALLVPGSAVRDGQLWVVRDGRAQLLTVKTGIVGSDMVEITGGLSSDATVILHPPLKLRPDQRVRTKP
jgi:RND family efflux transporter MFP subunit